MPGPVLCPLVAIPPVPSEQTFRLYPIHALRYGLVYLVPVRGFWVPRGPAWGPDGYAGQASRRAFAARARAFELDEDSPISCPESPFRGSRLEFLQVPAPVSAEGPDGGQNPARLPRISGIEFEQLVEGAFTHLGSITPFGQHQLVPFELCNAVFKCRNDCCRSRFDDAYEKTFDLLVELRDLTLA